MTVVLAELENEVLAVVLAEVEFEVVLAEVEFEEVEALVEFEEVEALVEFEEVEADEENEVEAEVDSDVVFDPNGLSTPMLCQEPNARVIVPSVLIVFAHDHRIRIRSVFDGACNESVSLQSSVPRKTY